MIGRFRKKAREIALKTLYAFDINKGDKDINEILEDVIKDIRDKISENTLRYAYMLVNGIVDNLDKIDQIIQSHLKDWRLERLGYIERALLRLGTYELIFSDVPDKGRVFTDILDLGKCYSLNEDALKFVNGVLSAIYKDANIQSKIS
ncbi:transcription antitermination factor NusB [Hydrogenothermus marinus]|uniref:Transcription antitermination protein NusB n=1 Tax=Hydrogenothermus marinus TaxID=133270 RepID=A0A3M0BI21_9AQUI|nr:transcription antitermination factor NusB [Hydrogenothermus marinus]RMA97063.1 NusB antitermination factor [Hydrogenothermus marinus]